MSYEVDVLAPWLSERRFQSASPCSDQILSIPPWLPLSKADTGSRFIRAGPLFGSSFTRLFLPVFFSVLLYVCFLFALLSSISPLLWAFQPCHPGPSLTQILSKPTPSLNAFLRLGAAQGGWQSKLSVPEALSSVPGTNRLTSTSHCLPLQSPSSLHLHSFLS